MTRSYFILNELQVLRLCVLALAGRRPVVLHVWPLLGVNRRWLQKVSAYLEKRGLVADPFLLHPTWRRFIEKQGGVSAYGFYTNVYMKLEPAQEELFNLRALSNRLSVFAQAVRHRIATHYTDLHWLILAMRDLDRKIAFTVYRRKSRVTPLFVATGSKRTRFTSPFGFARFSTL